MIAALRANGDGLKIDPECRTASVVAKKCSFMGIGTDLAACTYGRSVFWQRPTKSSTQSFREDIDRTLLDREYLVVISNQRAWWLRNDGTWTARRLPNDLADYDLDGTSGDLHLLMKDGSVKELTSPLR